MITALGFGLCRSSVNTIQVSLVGRMLMSHRVIEGESMKYM